MFEKNDEKYLARVIGRNEAVLFLGAGFSLNASNRLGEKFPKGWELSKKLWEFLNFPGEYDNSQLPLLYQSFISKGIKKTSKTDFLNKNLLSKDIPLEYDIISSPYWYKIYTINVDDILDQVFRRSNRATNILTFPKDEFKERDQSLDQTHIIHLHGKLPCEPDELIFSGKQYARAGLKDQPLYSQFVYDFVTHPTIFVGTDLNEPLFERYIEAREGKRGHGELRPKSFIITPSSSPVKSQVLKDEYNIIHVKGTTSDFLKWLKTIVPSLPDKKEILKRTLPNYFNLINLEEGRKIKKNILLNFAKSFRRVPTDYKIKNERSAYLRGSNPTWNDIFSGLDIPRTISKDLFSLLNDFSTTKDELSKLKIVSIFGSAGSGKSTILKRVGLTLSQNGITGFISESDALPKIHEVAKALEAIGEKMVLLFDNAQNIISLIPKMVSEFSKLDKPPIIVVSLRSNQFNRLNYYVDPDLVDHETIFIPDLDDDEIDYLITKLDKHNLLGKLKGMSSQKRIQEFKYRSKKQILVAMKEATKGRSFNEIIKNEFEEIAPYEAKILCLCIALSTELGYTNTKQDFIGFSELNHSDSLNILKHNLAGTVLWVGEAGKFMIRHRILADYMIRHCADQKILKIAYIRVLSVLAPELKVSDGSSKKFNLFKSLINHRILYQRFKNNINEAREVYESITPYFEADAHFWLQYGSLELEGDGGDLALAENYINQAESLRPDYVYIKNAKCNLYYKLSTATNNFSEAFEYKASADELYETLAIATGNKSHPHIHHIHCRGTFRFILKWITEKGKKISELEKLLKEINKAVLQHPRDQKLEEALEAINKAYLSQSIPDKDIIMPDLPF